MSITNHHSLVYSTALVSFMSLALAQPILAQAPPPDPTPQELTQGPVHEAFGQPVVFNPQPGIIVAKQPPDPVPELAPDQKPEGDHVIWISGYWSWDDQRKDFIWISGFWRAVPPGKTWVPGYWAATGDRFQWVSGFWSSAENRQAEYLPQPPASLEMGASVQAPSADVIWSPGCWVWRDARYLWRPGFWVPARADWIWIPAHYEWTPVGYVFTEGYWDYPLQRRGLLFAPVIFPNGLLRPQYVYTPRVCLDPSLLLGQLFIQPALHHYCFGDYYAPECVQRGIYPWFGYHNSRLGYDPFMAHATWVNRDNDRWLPNLREQYRLRRDVVAERPPQTFASLQTLIRQPNAPQHFNIARPLSEMARLKNPSIPLQRVDATRLNEIHNVAKDTRFVMQERAKFEGSRGPVIQPKLPQGQPQNTVKWDLPKANAKVNIPVAPKVQGLPGLPAFPAHHAEPGKIVHQPLPHPDDFLRHLPGPPKKQ